jgi:hypothetical protein
LIACSSALVTAVIDCMQFGVTPLKSALDNGHADVVSHLQAAFIAFLAEVLL